MIFLKVATTSCAAGLKTRGGALGFLGGVLQFLARIVGPLVVTPGQTEGPFYPDKMPLDTDNDLLVINDAITPAVGEITHLTGRVLTTTGQPIRNAFVEIWQVDPQGIYLHPGDPGVAKRDQAFQSYGEALTDAVSKTPYAVVLLDEIEKADAGFFQTQPVQIEAGFDFGLAAQQPLPGPSIETGQRRRI